MIPLKTIFLLIAFFTFIETGHGCLDGFTLHKGYCYAVLRVQVTWAEALRVCQAVGSQLATIVSGDEQHWIDRFLTGQDASLLSPEVWLAGNDLLAEGVWRWATDVTPLDYTNWAPGEPDNVGHEGRQAHCLGLFRASGHLWDDDYCEKKMQPLCKHEDESA